ncbi:MAG: DUF58 domain-containing protein [Magnetococcales bacterium]|nr:DUF58 domain-containing protein [Magnetococcales bacterium]
MDATGSGLAVAVAGARGEVLDWSRVRLRPLPQGWILLGVAGLLLTGFFHLNLNPGLFLIFWILGALFVAAFHTWRSVRGVRVRVSRAAPVFAGQTARFPVELDNGESRWPRFGLGVAAELGAGTDGAEMVVDLQPGERRSVMVVLPARTRGWLGLGRLVVGSCHPLGLMQARGMLTSRAVCLVYPRPEPEGPPPPPPARGGGEEDGRGMEDADFSGLREYLPGDSPRRIHWKGSARQGGLLVKEFSGVGEGVRWLDWNSLTGMDPEARLSRLCRWVLEVNEAGDAYGLRLPGSELPPDQGAIHQERCLRALALHGLPGFGKGEGGG